MMHNSRTHGPARGEPSASTGAEPSHAPPREHRGPGNQAMQSFLSPTASAGPVPVGRRDDPAERSADRMADRILAGKGSGRLLIPRPAGPSPAWPGRPLASAERRRFDAHFDGLDQVRVHDGPEAARATSALGARAFAIGRGIAFAPGYFRPGTADGDRLLAHELTHLAQGGNVLRRQPVPEEEMEEEKEAEEAEDFTPPELAKWLRPRSLLSLDYSGPEVCGGRPCVTDEMLKPEPTEEEEVDQIAASVEPIVTFGPFVIGVTPGATNLPASVRTPPGQVTGGGAVGGSRVVQGNPDLTSTSSTFSFANRTGHQPMGIGANSLAGVEEATLVAHGTRGSWFSPTRAIVGNTFLTAEQLADLLVATGWRGGTLRLAICHTGVGQFAQRLANALARLGAETVVIAPRGSVSIVDGAHGLPQVLPPGAPRMRRFLNKLGKGWRYIVPEVPEAGAQTVAPFHPSTWRGAGLTAVKMAAAMALSYLHSKAVAARVEQQRAETGFAPWGPTGDTLYDFGSWLLDPTDEAGRSIPLSARFDLPVWRQQFAERANKWPVGEKWKVAWTTSGDPDPFGGPTYRQYYGIYIKRPDGYWSTWGCKNCEGDDFPPDINKIIDPLVSDEEVRAYLEIPSPYSYGNMA